MTRRQSDQWVRAVERQAAKFPTRIGPKSAARLARLLGPGQKDSWRRSARSQQLPRRRVHVTELLGATAL